MTSHAEVTRVVSATREIAAGPEEIFEFIADPAQQPRWDGNENLAAAPAGQRVRRAGEVFLMTLTGGAVRENHVVEFDEGRCMAWKPAEPAKEPPGHLWRWDLERAGAQRTRARRLAKRNRYQYDMHVLSSTSSRGGARWWPRMQRPRDRD